MPDGQVFDQVHVVQHIQPPTRHGHHEGIVRFFKHLSSHALERQTCFIAGEGSAQQTLHEVLWKVVPHRRPGRVLAMALPSDDVHLLDGPPHGLKLQADKVERGFTGGEVPSRHVDEHRGGGRGHGGVGPVDDRWEGKHVVLGVEEDWNAVHAVEKVSIVHALRVLAEDGFDAHRRL